jgi:hypothetical protein
MVCVFVFGMSGLPVRAGDGEAANLSPALVERLRTEAPPERPAAKATGLWKASLVALAVAAAADVASSVGKRELNPALRGADGRFGGRGMAVKGLVTGSALVGQWLLVRRTPESGRYAAVANFGMAGVFTAAAVHNAGTKRATPAAGSPRTAAATLAQ